MRALSLADLSTTTPAKDTRGSPRTSAPSASAPGPRTGPAGAGRDARVGPLLDPEGTEASEYEARRSSIVRAVAGSKGSAISCRRLSLGPTGGAGGSASTV